MPRKLWAGTFVWNWCKICSFRQRSSIMPVRRAVSGVVCFAIPSVAENEEDDGRQRPHQECYPKPKSARSRALPSHLRGKRYRRKEDDEKEERPDVHSTVSDCHRNPSTEPALKCRTSAESKAVAIGGEALAAGRIAEALDDFAA